MRVKKKRANTNAGKRKTRVKTFIRQPKREDADFDLLFRISRILILQIT